jgi:signal transduction histidine kinase
MQRSTGVKLRLPAFRSLKWKLMASYLIFSPLLMLLTLYLLFLIALITIESFFVPALSLYGLQRYQDQLSPFFAHNGVADREELALWLKGPGVPDSGYDPLFRAIVDRQGVVMVSSGRHPVPVGTSLSRRLSPQAAANLRQVLTGDEQNQGVASTDPDGAVIVIVPIRGPDRRIDGTLIDDTGPDVYAQEMHYWFVYDSFAIVISAVGYTLFAALVGLVSGSFTANAIARRLGALVAAADRWGQGDFSTPVHDASPDELGQLARQLNRMSEQLQSLLQARRDLAIAEERNRLARDLHDSVKQHLFVVALQIGTAKLRLEQESASPEAYKRLVEAEYALHQAQEELSALILALRPAGLANKGLCAALQDLVAQWSRQTGIAVTLHMEDEPQLPLSSEEALFRVAQEALSNVARHSRASAIEIRLVDEPASVTLTIADNGCGFAVASGAYRGMGLLSMRERMQDLGGSVEVESRPGRGTRVMASCPRNPPKRAIHESDSLSGVRT